MSNPVGAVAGQNAQKGVKRSVQGNPVGVPMQLPGFRGRSVDAGAAVKAPKLRNGNLNNETSNVRTLPSCRHDRVTPRGRTVSVVARRTRAGLGQAT